MSQDDRYSHICEFREDAIREAFAYSEVGDTITICRGAKCDTDESCPMCARIVVVRGMTIEDVFEASKAYRA